MDQFFAPYCQEYCQEAHFIVPHRPSTNGSNFIFFFSFPLKIMYTEWKARVGNIFRGKEMKDIAINIFRCKSTPTVSPKILKPFCMMPIFPLGAHMQI